MSFWAGGYVQDVLIVISLLAVAAGLRRLVPPLNRLGMPDALVAGLLGMVLGPAALGLLPLSSLRLETVVYHALALVFISVSLQSPPSGERSQATRSLMFAIPAIASLQGIVGILCVLGWNAAGGQTLHSGFSMMLPLGFNQGPGPAMTLGSTWDDEAGMTHGAQIGLIMAALGYFWCCIVGVAIVAWGRRRGWDRAPGRGEAGGASPVAASVMASPRSPARVASLGGMEPLTAQFVAIALVYLATWLFLELVTPLLPATVQSMLYGFHFLIATGFALALRPLAARVPGGTPLDNDLLARISSTIVDVATAAALAAVSVVILGAYLWPVLLLSTVGGAVTAVVCLWLARRAFPARPFAHAVVAFGALTGTATTGLALLRMLDPQLEGPAARNYVLAVPAAAGLGLPLFLLMPMAVLDYPASYPGKLVLVLGVLVAYLVVLVLAWRMLAPLRVSRPLSALWPPLDGKR